MARVTYAPIVSRVQGRFGQIVFSRTGAKDVMYPFTRPRVGVGAGQLRSRNVFRTTQWWFARAPRFDYSQLGILDFFRQLLLTEYPPGSRLQPRQGLLSGWSSALAENRFGQFSWTLGRASQGTPGGLTLTSIGGTVCKATWSAGSLPRFTWKAQITWFVPALELGVIDIDGLSAGKEITIRLATVQAGETLVTTGGGLWMVATAGIYDIPARGYSIAGWQQTRIIQMSG